MGKPWEAGMCVLQQGGVHICLWRGTTPELVVWACAGLRAGVLTSPLTVGEAEAGQLPWAPRKQPGSLRRGSHPTSQARGGGIE